MNDLIVVQVKKIGAEKMQVTTGRELHSILESKKDFTSWMKQQLNSLNFKEGIDYIVEDKRVVYDSGTKIQKNYILTVDAAKHIAMVSKTKMGEQIRQYFIDVEKAYQAKQFEKISKEAVAQFSEQRINKLIEINNKQEMTAVSIFLESRRFCELADTFVDILRTTNQVSDESQIYQSFLNSLQKKIYDLQNQQENIAEIAQEFDKSISFYKKFNGTENQISDNARKYVQDFKSEM